MSDYRVISGKTDIYAVIGDPVIHSLSPVVHNAVFQHEKLDKVYLALRVDKKGLKLAIDSVRLFGIKGLNVTMPLKEDVLKHLDHLSPEAELIGAVNCVANCDGVLKGYNTDSTGFWRSLEKISVGGQPDKVFIFGAGGVSKAIATKVAIRGVEVVYVTNRTHERAVVLANKLRCLKKTDIRVVEWNPESWRKVIGECHIIVNCTSIGMNNRGDLAQIVPWLEIRNDAIIYETIYEPFETNFIIKARELQLKAVGGINLFIHQACDSSRIWTCREPPYNVIAKAIRNYIKKNNAIKHWYISSHHSSNRFD
ncbi:MAG: shikimate dehydrogenase [Thermoanaerobacterales bacterium]|nr:shikimate dehydrogenase [Thermoanaerobacterales bacterium]